MIALAAIALFAQTSIGISVGNSKQPDSVAIEKRAAQMEARRDSLRKMRAGRDSLNRKRREAKVIQVTPALMVSAFRDEGARDLLNRARAARLGQDSSLIGYEATGYERMSVGMGLSRFGRDHLLFRTERASQVYWSRAQGAVVQVKGQRTASPMLEDAGSGGVDFGGFEQVPYFPGRETMWIGSGIAKSDVSDDDIIHPLAKGSEAYYSYATGDSVTFQLPDGGRIQLREVLVRPRTPRWNVVVGSLWFDQSSAQLVRAVYRLAVPMDILAIAKEEEDTANKDDNMPRWVRGIITPMTAQIKAVTVEYGLHEGRFWLPRIQTLEGDAQVSFMHVPFKMVQSYKYASVNGTENFPSFAIAVGDTAQDSVSRAARRTRRRNECKNGAAERMRVERHEEVKMNIIVRVPCDTVALTRSAELPKSIYDEGDEMFGSADRDELIRQALTIGAQAGFGPQPPTFRYGFPLTRFNRIEGLSSAIGVDQNLGNGYAAHALFRIGLADWSPNGELSLDRSDGRVTIGGGVYRRLSAANDWADPLGFRGSFSALFFGRDDGFYYRNAGAEMTLRTDDAFLGDWRLFAEQEFDAGVKTEFSFAHPSGVNGKLTNIDAVNGTVVGLSTEHHGSYGLDPHGLRILSDLKAEAAAGTMDFSRGSLQFTASHGLGRLFDGALTLGGGTSGGKLPIQKQWFLGGVRTVRGQRAGAAIGDAFWLSSVELGTSSVGIRKVVFADLGWAGSRKVFGHPGRPLSGAGVGASFLDGLVRFDVAKGIYPETKIRANLYVEARF
jgi:hypothetical protein